MKPITQISRHHRIFWIAVSFVIAAALSLPLTAMADIVSGRILGVDEKPILNGSFTAKDAKGAAIPFKSNKDGNYSVFLEPGKYTVTISGDATVSGTLESFPQPRQADVHLKKSDGK